MKWSKYRKAFAFGGGATVVILSNALTIKDLVPVNDVRFVDLGILVLTSFLTYRVPNASVANISTLVRVHPEMHLPDKRLGRHVEHDPRSRDYDVAHVLRAAPLVSKRWQRRIPVLDQGNVGSCTGNGATGYAGTDNAVRQGVTAWRTPASGRRTKLTETWALDFYERETVIDGIPGVYPPDDTGSSGLAAAKVLQQLGLCTSYRHSFTAKTALAALSQIGPVLVGVKWFTGCDNPDPDGRIRPTGTVRGGHEIVFDEIDVENQRVWFTNSWGTSWSVAGRAYVSFSDFAAWIRDGGDVVIPIV